MLNLHIRDEWNSKCVPPALELGSFVSRKPRFAHTLCCAMFGVSWQTQIKESFFFRASADPNKGFLLGRPRQIKELFLYSGRLRPRRKELFFAWFPRQMLNLHIREDWSSRCVPQALELGSFVVRKLPFARTLCWESHVWRVMANTNKGGNHLFGSAQSIKGIVPLFGSALRAQIKIFVPLLGFLSQPK